MRQPLFQSGDRVRFKSYTRLVEEFGDPHAYGGMKIPAGWAYAMQRFCGQTFTVSEVIPRSFYYGGNSFQYVMTEDMDDYTISEEMLEPEPLEPASPSMVINVSVDDLSALF